MAYITIDRFKLLSLVPGAVLTQIESTPGGVGWLAAQIENVSAYIDSRLGKRYTVPFTAPVPPALERWIVDIVSFNAWLKRGMSANDESFEAFKQNHDRAYDEVKEASDSELGLFELPRIVDGKGQQTITRGFAPMYSEASPYVAFDRQSRIGRGEDHGGGGTTR